VALKISKTNIISVNQLKGRFMRSIFTRVLTGVSKIFLAVLLVFASGNAVATPLTQQLPSATTAPATKTIQPKLIALTFDDGPSAKYTPTVLDILKQNNAKATFFVTGGSVSLHPEVLKRAFAEGHEIGNHSYTHPNCSKLAPAAIAKELNKTNALIRENINVAPRLFRPPFGACNAQCKAVVAQQGLQIITWDYMVNDWDSQKTTPEIIANSIIQHARHGAIMNMHDGYENKEKTVAALPKIIATLKERGYQLVTVAELLKIAPYLPQKK
jgi:peptidoglycan-N-acetylglucosamine deacetylase